MIKKYEQIISTIADSEERRMYRLLLEKPVIDGLFEYLNSIRNGLLPKSPLAKAVNYTVDNEQYLRNYDCPIILQSVVYGHLL